MAASPPDFSEIFEVARLAIAAIYHSTGQTSCVIGSAACALYGMKHRVPGVSDYILLCTFLSYDTMIIKDVDIVVSTTMDTQIIKERIVSMSHRFFLVSSANPHNTYQVLWCTLASDPRWPRSCKVDILTPGILNIPWIPYNRINLNLRFPDIPLIQLFPLLFLKLQGWTDRRDSGKWSKMQNDLRDITAILNLLVLDRTRNNLLEWLPDWFVQGALRRVAEHVSAFPQYAIYWSALGILG